MRRGFQTAVTLIALVSFQTAALAANTKPLQTEAPAPLRQPTPQDHFDCNREFLYRGNVLKCDSDRAADGAGLRPILSPVPNAISELDAYQKSRNSAKIFGYTGTLGVAAVAGGWIAGHQIQGDRGIIVRNTVAGIGVLLLVGSLLGGLILLNISENHLYDAVKNYNTAKPNDPIELRFSHQFSL
ncbi:hypothetical protein K2X30_02675 [bacterium]|jgi:hypothetical protein|nr:hypothetical protein [bacterium]